MKALILAALLALLSGTASAVTPTATVAAVQLPAQPAPPACAPGWYFTETQSWWRAAGLDLDGGVVGQHVHVGVCWPLNGAVPAGPVDVSFRVIFHSQPATSRFVRLRAGTATKTLWDQTTGLPRLVNDSPVWLSARLDFSGMSGLQELRFSAMVDDAAGARQYQSAGLQFYVGADLGTPGGYDVARSWYTAHGYQNPGILPADFPTEAVRGTWSPNLTRRKGSGGLDVRETLVTIDPDAHAGNMGWIVSHTTAEARGTVPIDTTKLAPGWHRLVIEVSDGQDAGVLLIPFEVAP